MIEFSIIKKKHTVSTNADVKAYFQTDHKEGLVIVAEHQSEGRGRNGHWIDDSQNMLLMTIFLKPNIPLFRYLELNHCVLESLKKTLLFFWQDSKKKTSFDLTLRWPNDLFLNGKKICGILQEGEIEKGHLRSVALGIGLNVGSTASFFHQNNLPHATSLQCETGEFWNKSLLLQKFLSIFQKMYSQFLLS